MTPSIGAAAALSILHGRRVNLPSGIFGNILEALSGGAMEDSIWDPLLLRSCQSDEKGLATPAVFLPPLETCIGGRVGPFKGGLR